MWRKGVILSRAVKKTIGSLERHTLTCIFYSGPGFHISDFESNRIIGEAQYLGAQKVMNGALSPVNGAVKSVHTYLTMHVLSIFCQF